MADFHQNGIITTLHNISNRSIEEMEAELVSFSRQRPMALILPSLYSELGGKALPNIVEELRRVPYLSQIIIGLDRADEAQYRHATEFFSVLPQDHRVLWNDGPRLREIDAELKSLELAPKVRVNGISPGYVPTEVMMTALDTDEDALEKMAQKRVPLQRLGTPGDMGSTAVYLASEGGSWVTGQTIIVAGGL